MKKFLIAYNIEHENTNTLTANAIVCAVDIPVDDEGYMDVQETERILLLATIKQLPGAMVVGINNIVEIPKLQ